MISQQRNLDRFVVAISERFTTADLQHWWDAVDTVIDVYITMHRDVPAFSRLHFGDVVDLRLLDETQDNNAVIAQKLTELLAKKFDLEGSQLQLPLSVAVEAADAVLNLAFRRDPAGDAELVSEAKELVRGYLANRLPPGQPKDMPSPR